MSDELVELVDRLDAFSDRLNKRLDRQDEAISRLDGKVDRLGSKVDQVALRQDDQAVRFEGLREVVNDQMHAFETSLGAKADKVDLDAKAEKKELIVPVISRTGKRFWKAIAALGGVSVLLFEWHRHLIDFIRK